MTEQSQDATILAKGRHDVLLEKAKEWDEYQRDVDVLEDAIEAAKASLFDPTLVEKPVKEQHAVQDVSDKFVACCMVYRVSAAWKSNGKWFLFSRPGKVMEFVKT